MPVKRSHSLFSRLSRLRSRIRRVKAELSRLISVTKGKDLKFQLREVRGLLLEADDMLTPGPEQSDEPLRTPAATPDPAPAAA